MKKECTLIVKDEVNCKIEGLDVQTRRKLSDKLKFFMQYARHTSAYKLGRWDGTISFCDIGARTYLNALDDLLPIVAESGYNIHIDDQRTTHKFEFETVDKDSYSHINWPEGHPKAGEPIEIRDHQIDMINTYVENMQCVSVCPTAGGKAQPLHSKIKTPNGWTTMGDIQVGDIVSTPDGSTSNVTGLFPQGEKDIYKVTFADGRTAECCKEHLWNVYNKHFDGKEGKWRTWTLGKMQDWLSKNESRTLHIPLIKHNDVTDIELPMDPWLLGFMLGDGTFRHGNFAFSSADTELVEKVASKLHPDYYVLYKDNYDYSINIKSELFEEKRKEQGFQKEVWHYYKKIIKDLGLDNKLSSDKFIPDMYKNASYSQKLEMIRGLMDSDGCAEGNAKATFCTTSERLADDIRDMLWSIGAIVKKRASIPTYMYNGIKKTGKTAYTIRIKMPDPHLLFSLTRKVEKIGTTYQHNNSVRLQITSIEKIGNELAQCIMIDHPDHLYITDNYVVTHNTLVTAILSEKVQKYGRSVVIVPTRDLVTQTEEDYINMGLDVGVYYGDRKEYNKTHTICTWQSLEVMNKLNNGTIEDFIEGVVCVMVDEVHKAKADVLRKLLAGPFKHTPIRWGLTGTLPEEEHEKVSVLVCIGPVAGTVKASELQEKGYLSNLQIQVLQLKDTPYAPGFDNFQTELKWITTNRFRIDYLASEFEDMANEGNTLVLVDRVETGKMLEERIENSVFIYSNVKSDKRKEEYKSVQTEDNKLIIATYGVASTGINIPRIFNLVLFEPGKSFVRVIQSIGRGLRVAKDKDFVNVYDITSSCKYSKRHLTKRKRFYKDAEYPFKVKKIDY